MWMGHICLGTIIAPRLKMVAEVEKASKAPLARIMVVQYPGQALVIGLTQKHRAHPKNR